jgi:predicted O-linked N-acetylglucosamine transferase (SPINDLY family)
VQQLLAAWQNGQATPAEILPALEPIAYSAADLSNLGALYRALGRAAEAEATYRRAIAQEPGFAAAWYNLGNLLADQDRAEAADAFRTAVTLDPAYAKAWHGLATLLHRAGRLGDAIRAFRTSIAHAPDWIEARTGLGVALMAADRYDAAAQALLEATALDPDHAGAHGNLAAVYLRAGCPIAAEREARESIRLAPREYRWLTNLAVALLSQCRHTEAEACYREALAQRPDYPLAHGNLLFALNYRPDLTPEAIFAEYRAWDAKHGRRATASPPEPEPLAGRRLRVGYVSPDLREHAVALFAEPLLAAHDRRAIELFCYAEVPNPDTVTARFRALADHWRSTVGLDDEAVAEMIRRDRIDVLVDMGGHTASSRLPVFTHRPAPVQVAYLLGHGYTSGLSAMDVFIADDLLAPPEAASLFAERIVRLPHTPIVYSPPKAMPAVGPLPARAHGHVTFGYFGRTERLNDEVIAIWSRILSAVPGSRLVLNNRGFQEPEFCALFAARFAANGIAAERLDLIYTSPQPCTWVAYGAIDIALDPFPHNAGTTTVEALWQGVPVVSKADRPGVGRLGASILGAAGLPDWVTATVDDYVRLAAQQAADLTALARLRSSLRDRIAASPLCDAAGLARAVEGAYRDLWRAWCATAAVPVAAN